MNPTGIEYVDLSWNPIAMRCSRVSPACDNCWHLATCDRMARNTNFSPELREVYAGKAPPMLIESRLQQPLRDKTPRTIATQFMGDLFGDAITNVMRDRVFAVMAKAEWHTFLVLTKRPKGMRIYMEGLASVDGAVRFERWKTVGGGMLLHKYGMMFRRGESLPNVWLGVTVETPDYYWRIIELMQVPAAIRWVSLEPMLDAIDIEHHLSPNPVCDGCGWVGPSETEGSDHVRNAMEPGDSPERCGTWRMPPSLDWVVAGSESGQGRRPSDPDWFRSLRDQCVAAGVPYFLKQMDVGGKVVSMPPLDDRAWDQKPEVEHG